MNIKLLPKPLHAVAAAVLGVAVLHVTSGQSSPSTPSFQDSIPTVESFEEVTWISLLHYALGPSASSVFNGYGKPLTKLWEINSEQGTDVVILAAPESQRLYVSFRGTDGEEADIETDLNFNLVPYGDSSSTTATFPPGEVHEGFNKNLFGGSNKLYLTLDDQVRSSLEQYSGYKLIVMGHSLGGALAILYGVHLAKNVLPDTNVLVQTIGTPRVGDAKFKSSARDQVNLANWRLVYRRDVIARVPLEPQGFRHAGHLILLRGSETKVFFEQTGDSTNYAGVGANDFLLPSYIDERLVIPIFHHIPWSYLQGLASAKAEGWWPTEFVPFQDQEKVCCRYLFSVWCIRYAFPPC